MYRRVFGRANSRSRRIVRYSLLAVNLAVLVAVTGFVVHSSNAGEAVRTNSMVNAKSATSVNPLDQLSSADIAVHVARLTHLEEATSVTNHADSVTAQLAIVPSETTVVAKPQVVATALKSRQDIQKYTTVAGDTLASISAKFGVTSETIKWSNNLNSNTLSPGKELLISPVNGLIYEVKAGDTADSLANKYRSNKDQIIAFNDIELTGLKPGEKIVIPDGTLPSLGAPSNNGFAFGFAAIYGSNGYDFGWCTWWAAKRRADIGRPVPANLGDAYTWVYRAQTAGFSVGNTPQVGAVIWSKSGYPGHVGFVEQVLEDGSAWVTDMNSHGQVSPTDSRPAGGWNRVSWRHVTPDQFGNYRFIY